MSSTCSFEVYSDGDRSSPTCKRVQFGDLFASCASEDVLRGVGRRLCDAGNVVIPLQVVDDDRYLRVMLGHRSRAEAERNLSHSQGRNGQLRFLLQQVEDPSLRACLQDYRGLDILEERVLERQSTAGRTVYLRHH